MPVTKGENAESSSKGTIERSTSLEGDIGYHVIALWMALCSVYTWSSSRVGDGTRRGVYTECMYGQRRLGNKGTHPDWGPGARKGRAQHVLRNPRAIDFPWR